jgi:hypothetical protein
MEKAPTDFLASFAAKTSSIVKTTSIITANYMLAPTAATAELSSSPPRYLSLSKRSEAVRGEHLPSQDCPQLECQLRSVPAVTRDMAHHPCLL